ncbi:MAG: type II toxin-antitoxin system Phd/YefM family antitoxin [Candidatus Gracilibacteria bacterium]
MSKFFPRIASARDIQTKYRALFDEVMATKEPLVVLNNNKAEVVILDIKTYENLKQTKEDNEHALARHAIENYEGAKRKGKLKILHSLKDLL